ncbi:tRNA1(Val) (adenine(37)-N6)-methyltransferase [Abyssicoccus albus]|uniref:tRNA1(Val) (adenine(37)-N6)-methyltransferase n=1 Tax=Abyssicoccus albus TaxID=1817405 RepID=UPI00097E25F8|nr:tRNA1(Val) (adenine(37)-N6)-methyltransferase [Abyssicoccus albus]AQL56954.1 hypothetical protein BVH56_08555 [Abyssicoccus albus]
MVNIHERIDYLQREQLKIIQDDRYFSYGVDALILSYFVQFTKRDKVIYDLCTGQGIVPLLLTTKIKQQQLDTHITGIEIQQELADLATRSVQLNELERCITIKQQDVLDLPKQLEHSSVDMITVNPPYFTANQSFQHHNKHHRIARHEIAIRLEELFKVMKYLLKNKGVVYMIHRTERLDDIISTGRQYNINIKEIHPIYSSRASDESLLSVIKFVMNGKSNIKMSKPFYIYDESGEYSKEMMDIYYG